MGSLGYKESLPYKKKKDEITHHLRPSIEERIHWPGHQHTSGPETSGITPTTMLKCLQTFKLR